MKTNKVSAFLSKGIVRITLIVIAVLWTLPSVGLLISSFRSEAQIKATGWWTVFVPPIEITREFTMANYERVIGNEGMGLAFLNSLAVAIPSTVIPITIAAFAAFAFAWMEFPGRRFLFVVVVGLLVVPLQMALIPVLQIYTKFGLTGTYLAVWLAHTGFGMPLAVYILFNYISTLPKEIMESASIDGATPFTTFVRLVLPLSVPAIAALAIFQFLWVWNDLLVALVFLGGTPDVAVVTLKLQELIGSRGQDWHVLTAGAFVSMVLPLAVFFTLQRFFVKGLMAGSVKG
jgi:alpha-glucoside transport system permease protein